MTLNLLRFFAIAALLLAATLGLLHAIDPALAAVTFPPHTDTVQVADRTKPYSFNVTCPDGGGSTCATWTLNHSDCPQGAIVYHDITADPKHPFEVNVRGEKRSVCFEHIIVRGDAGRTLVFIIFKDADQEIMLADSTLFCSGKGEDRRRAENTYALNLSANDLALSYCTYGGDPAPEPFFGPKSRTGRVVGMAIRFDGREGFWERIVNYLSQWRSLP